MLVARGLSWNAQKRRKHSFIEYIKDFTSRKLLKNSFPNELESKFAKELEALPPSAYAGFDPTAESLHVGNLLILTNLLRAHQFGIRPIVLVGGATAQIGDPSGRLSERNTISEEIVLQNSKNIEKQIRTIFERASTSKEVLFVNNNEWFGKMGMIEYLRNCKRMQLGEMLRMGAVKARMEGGISFTEFSYQTMQAFDWCELAKKYGCRFQIGGSDQLGHLDFGSHYIKRTLNEFAAGVCLPLLTDSAGNKLGKSVGGGSLWLDASKTSPYHFYQYFAQLHDDKAEELFFMLSLKQFEDVKQIVENHRKNLGKWIVQKELAAELTRFVHGVEGLDQAERCTEALFGGKTANLSKLNREEILQLFGNTVEIVGAQIEKMGQLADLTRSDKNKGHVMMTKGAFSVNGIKKLNPEEDLKGVRLENANDLTLICWGKRKYQLIRWI